MVQTLIEQMRYETELELKRVIAQGLPGRYKGLSTLLTYHLGWDGEGAGLKAEGKRIRPLLVLCCTQAGGGDWRQALPAAVAVELVHNFSLIHDDIQDRSPLRRGRQTVWVKWGIAQAINAGDLMYTLAFGALQGLKTTTNCEIALETHRILEETCVRLTGGQYLDLSYETLRSLALDDYWPMIEGKTAALLSCCAEMGALVSGVDESHRRAFAEFGHHLGLAFQVQDDWLGIWGDEAQTGKSAESDLVSGKKTLPVLFALQQNQAFARRWMEGPIQADEVAGLARLLEAEGAQEFTLEHTRRLSRSAEDALDRAAVDEPGRLLLRSMIRKLLNREF